MVTKKQSSDSPRRVWRISAEAPLGEFVDPQAKAKAPAPPPVTEETPRDAGWVRSSWDLMTGLDVIETGPGELMSLFESPQPGVSPPPCRPCPSDVSQGLWTLRFARHLAELDQQAESKVVIAIAKKFWSTSRHLLPEDVARWEYVRERTR